MFTVKAVDRHNIKLVASESLGTLIKKNILTIHICVKIFGCICFNSLPCEEELNFIINEHKSVFKFGPYKPSRHSMNNNKIIIMVQI